MSLWYCPEHGLVGPEACCDKSSLARLSATPSGVDSDNPAVSDCCKAPVKVISSGEGTNYYECTNCNQPCDIASEEPQ